MATAPFPEAQLGPILYTLLGVMVAAVIFATIYIRRLHREMHEIKFPGDDSTDLRTDQLGLSKRAEDVLDEVLIEPSLQNELPDKLGVSKATVSNAISELKDRGLIKRKKKANTYLIEPKEEEIEEQQP